MRNRIFLVFLLKILLTHSFWLSGHRVHAWGVGGGTGRKEAALQAGNQILDENALQQSTHGIFPSPQVLDFISTENREIKTNIKFACL